MKRQQVAGQGEGGIEGRQLESEVDTRRGRLAKGFALHGPLRVTRRAWVSEKRSTLGIMAGRKEPPSSVVRVYSSRVSPPFHFKVKTMRA